MFTATSHSSTNNKHFLLKLLETRMVT